MDRTRESEIRLIISELRLSASKLHAIQHEVGNTLEDMKRIGIQAGCLDAMIDEMQNYLLEE